MTTKANDQDQVKKAVSFHYHPFDFEHGRHAVEKAEKGGKSRRYLAGVSSGSKLDKHEERMTERCVKSFHDQGSSGDILLYPDIHGIQASKDIGILVKSEIMEDGNWMTEYRLYDEDDDVDRDSIETARKIWKQVKGEPPYKIPRQKGFSVEGFIPQGGIISAQKSGDGKVIKRVMDQVLLDGVVLVPRPAYQDSIAAAVYKALGEMTPERTERVREEMRSTFTEVLKNMDAGTEFWKRKSSLEEALEKSVEEIMGREDETRKDQLALAYQEFSGMMVELVMKSSDLFQERKEVVDAVDPYGSGRDSVKTHLSGEVAKSICSFAASAGARRAQKSPAIGVIEAIVEKSKNRRKN